MIIKMINNWNFEEGNASLATQSGNVTENFVVLTGSISSEQEFSHEVFGERFYKFVIEVKRLSDTSDFLPVTFSERVCDRRRLLVGAAIEIIGQIRSYNRYTEKRNKLLLTVFALEITVLGADYKNDDQQVAISGYICKMPVFRITPFGREISDILLAVNRAYKKSDYIPLIAWGRNARYANKLEVGDKISVVGRMQSREYHKSDADGTIFKKTALEVSVIRIIKM